MTCGPAPGMPNAPFPDVRVQGVVYGNRTPSVLIDGVTRFVGERVGKAKIVAVEVDGAILELNGQRRKFTLAP